MIEIDDETWRHWTMALAGSGSKSPCPSAGLIMVEIYMFETDLINSDYEIFLLGIYHELLWILISFLEFIWWGQFLAWDWPKSVSTWSGPLGRILLMGNLLGGFIRSFHEFWLIFGALLKVARNALERPILGGGDQEYWAWCVYLRKAVWDLILGKDGQPDPWMMDQGVCSDWSEDAPVVRERLIGSIGI